MSTLPLVSCLCLTRNKPRHLARAITCFLGQTYERRELVVVHRSDDSATKAVLERYADQRQIVPVSLDKDPARTLGHLRNISIERSNGDYFCQWDDDDWYHEDRVRLQVAGALDNHQDASVLTHLLFFETVSGSAYLSNMRLWEGTILCRKAALGASVRYRALPRMEDSFFMNAVIEHARVYPLVAPQLYIYEIHKSNTWNSDHFNFMLARAQPLSSAATAQIRGILDGEHSMHEASQLLSSEALLGSLKYFHYNNLTLSDPQLEGYRLQTQHGFAAGLPERGLRQRLRAWVDRRQGPHAKNAR
jgi:hypothetical protein